MKGYNSGTARWKRYPRQGMGKGHGDSMPSPSPTLPNLHVFTNKEALQTHPILLDFYGGFITEALLIKSLATGD